MTQTDKKAQPTPGPWTVRPNVLAGDLGVFDIVRDAPGPLSHVFVATLQNEADARLIAAAPRMLDLVRAVATLADVENADERAMLAERYAADAIQLVRDLHGEGQ